MPVSHQALEVFLNKLQACSNVEAVWSTFQEEVARDGYSNAMLARMSENPQCVEVVFGDASPQQLRRQHDQTTQKIASGNDRTTPEWWVESIVRNARAEVKSYEQPYVNDAPVALTIPIYGPDSTCNLISLSLRGEPLEEPLQLEVMKLKSFATIERYQALRLAADSAPFLHVADRTDAACTGSCASHTSELPSLRPKSACTRSDISDEECRTLALVDISSRRYNAGLLALNERVNDILGKPLIQRCIERGLIEEDADDMRFNFVFRPTVKGQRHIKNCPDVSRWRAQVWSTYVEIHEKPID